MKLALLDKNYMAEALADGAKGLGLTSPNPPVGAIIVSEGVIIGRGWHKVAGGPHAEIVALGDAERKFGPDAVRGATLYVTLEPCSTQGRTPPCTAALLAAGLKRVVVGTVDPNRSCRSWSGDSSRGGDRGCYACARKRGSRSHSFFHPPHHDRPAMGHR